MRHEPKLIVIRGNSGSGKSTIARKIREQSNHKIALIEQDYLRRVVLKEKESIGSDNISLIFQTATFALERGYDVLLEGILNFKRYGEVLKKLQQACPNNYFYYVDVSFEETLNRHATKENAHEFGEERMRDWYKESDLTGFDNETIIPEELTLEESVQKILFKTGL